MNIVGLINNKEDAYEIQRIAKHFIVGNRARILGRMARLKTMHTKPPYEKQRRSKK